MQSLQRVGVEGYRIQGLIGDPDTVFQSERFEPGAALEKQEEILISDVATSRKVQRKQVWAPESVNI